MTGAILAEHFLKARCSVISEVKNKSGKVAGRTLTAQRDIPLVMLSAYFAGALKKTANVKIKITVKMKDRVFFAICI